MLKAKIALTTVLEAGGIGMFGWGLWQVYEPIAWIGGGVFLILVTQGIIKPKGSDE